MDYRVVIPAAGSGQRMGAGKNKLFLLLNDIPIIVHTLKTFESHVYCREIALVVSEDDRRLFEELIKMHHITKVKHIVMGGERRQDSVHMGLLSLESNEPDSVVLVHDGARPFVTQQAIERVVGAAEEHRAAVLAVPVKDTIKKVEHHQVVETIDRSSLWAVQTPQAFLLSHIIDAYRQGKAQHIDATDDASLIEKLGGKVYIVQGDYNNIKITTPEDLLFGERILQEKGESL